MGKTRPNKTRPNKPEANETVARAVPPADEPMETPEEKDRRYLAMARQISRIISDVTGAWRTCPERCCRRAKRCVAPHIECSNPPTLPDLPPDVLARNMDETHRMLSEIVAEADAKRERKAADAER